MSAAAKKFDGPDRRKFPASDRRRDIFGCCFEHSGLIERVTTIEAKADHLEGQGFITSKAYFLYTGLLVSIFIAVLGTSVFLSFQTSQALMEIQNAQVTISLQISFLQENLKDLKGKMATKNHWEERK